MKIGPYKDSLSIDQQTSLYYWLSTTGLTTEQCQQFIDIGKDEWKNAETVGSCHLNLTKKAIRESNIFWINDEKIYEILWSYMEDANKHAGFNYDIEAVEEIQLTQYCKGGFYSWHMDGPGSHRTSYDRPDNKFVHGRTRKLSMTILLNSDFEGGQFQIYNNKAEDLEQPKMSTGSIIVFPSFSFHRVTPVTKGTRYSLVAWFIGPPFR